MHRFFKVAAAINVIMPRACDNMVVNQVRDLAPKRRGSCRADQLVTLCRDERDRNLIVFQSANRIHFVLEEGADREPREKVRCRRFQGIERRYQDQPVQFALSCQVSSNAAADAESCSDDRRRLGPSNRRVMVRSRVPSGRVRPCTRAP